MEPSRIQSDSDETVLEVPQPKSHGDGKKKDVQRKKRKLTSGVWQHFTLLASNPGEQLYCECNKCGRKYAAGSKNGTGNLLRHLDSCVRMSTRDIGQYMINSDGGSYSSTLSSKFNQERFRELVVHAIIRHDLPFSFVQYEGIRNIFNYLEPRVSNFSRNTAKSDIKKMHAHEIGRLRGELIACPSRVCLTSDAWTSIATDGYLSLTAHYLDNDWVLQKRLLNFSYMPPPHSGICLAEKIYGLASDWGIEKKLFSITLDNASANDKCVEILKTQLKLNNALIHKGALFHVRCCAHILNLIVQEGLKEIAVAVENVRNSVKYVKGSQARKEKFIHCVSQTSLNPKKGLVQDVPTRWNSTYKMLSSAIYFRPAIEHLKLSDSNFDSCPTSEEWETVQQICDFLEVFHDATLEFSGSLYPTANLYFPQVFMIQMKLYEESNSDDPHMKKMADPMFEKFNKYWCEFNVLLAVAVVFDPRYKFEFVEFSYEKLYGSESAELKKVKDTLEGVFAEYKKESTDSPASSSASQGINVVNSHEVIVNDNKQSSTIWKEFDERKKTAQKSKKTELDLYLEEPRSERTSPIQILEFWRSHQFRYPNLTRLARNILCVPVSTVASESAFSIGGRILDQYRSSMAPDVVEALICCRDWLFGAKVVASLKLEELTQDVMAANLSNETGSVVDDDASFTLN